MVKPERLTTSLSARIDQKEACFEKSGVQNPSPFAVSSVGGESYRKPVRQLFVIARRIQSTFIIILSATRRKEATPLSCRVYLRSVFNYHLESLHSGFIFLAVRHYFPLNELQLFEYLFASKELPYLKYSTTLDNQISRQKE